MVERNPFDEQAIYVISVAAELAGVHPQTLRVYERKGLVNPRRTAGNTRRYSERDVERLRKIQELTNEGVNLAGVMRILELEEELREQNERYRAAVEERDVLQQELRDVIGGRNDVALVPLKDVRRVRRALKSDFIEKSSARRVFTAGPAQDE